MLNVVMIGGMSECGKSHACKYLAKNGFVHQKIVFFENELCNKFGASGTQSDQKDRIAALYESLGHERVFQEMEKLMIAFCKEKDIKNLVLDSTTRSDMVKFFQKADVNFLSIYVERDFDKRVEGEWVKLDKTKPIEEVREMVLAKDKTKLLRKADQVKGCSLVITNNGSVKEYEEKLTNTADFFLGLCEKINLLATEKTKGNSQN